jgi:hypothetical protein
LLLSPHHPALAHATTLAALNMHVATMRAAAMVPRA